MTYQPKRAPRYRLYHRNWRTGYLQNSAYGDAEARDRGIAWRDRDFHLSSDSAWINAHGRPEKVWGTERFEAMPWSYWQRRRYRKGKRVFHLRDARETFADAKATGGKVEAEIKNVRPQEQLLPAALRRMRRHAEAVWGDAWREHVTIKVVSTMGGRDYALHVMRCAHDAGFRTLLTVRGRDRFKRYKGATYITWVRNSAVIR